MLAYIYTKIYIFALIDNIDIMTITTTIFIVAGALAVFITAMHFANLFLPYDPITPGKSITVYLDGKFNRVATITSIENGCIYVYDKFPLPLHYRGKFYAVGRMTDGHKVMFLGKRKLYLLMRFVEDFRKIARIPEFEKEV